MDASMTLTTRKPVALKPGDTIAVVSPASAVEKEKTKSMVDLLTGAGYRVRFGDYAFHNDGFFAGIDAARAQDLTNAFEDPIVRAILCSRGGYGCARLLPLLDLDSMAASRTLFLGFSDITALHLALNRRGLPTVHAPMALSFSVEREKWVYESFLRVLRGEDPIASEAPRGETVVGGCVEGTVTGGCLCLLTDSIGTPDALDPRGKIVLIEDVDENPHRVDAMLTHLVLSGLAEQAAGFVVGEMTRTDEKPDLDIGSRPWLEIVRERLEPVGKPLIVNYPFGHCKNMLSLPLGIRARLDADSGTLAYLENLCA